MSDFAMTISSCCRVCSRSTKLKFLFNLSHIITWEAVRLLANTTMLSFRLLMLLCEPDQRSRHWLALYTRAHV